MANQEIENTAVLSELKIDHIVFDELSFKRKGFKQQEEQKVEFQVGFAIDKIDTSKYRVSLKIIADSENEYTAEARMSAFCTIDENAEFKDEILQKNVIAILFPYVRSELTLLTSQPEVTPIVLPALNINALIDNAEPNA